MDDGGEVERLALEMVVRFGGGAARVARGLAESAEEQQRASAQAWRDIADAVERLLTVS
jgi:hypothetical protein